MGKKGGDIIRASTLSASAPSLLAGRSSVTRASARSPLREERQPLDVVPVQVGQQHGAAERFVAEELGHPPQARAGVEEQRGTAPRRRLVVGQRDAGGVAAEADVLGTRGRCRPTGPAEV